MPITRYTGVHTLRDLLGYDDQSVLEFGEDQVAAIVQRDLQALNAQVLEELSVYAGQRIFRKDQRLDRYGVSRKGEMVISDEFGRPTAKKAVGGINVGYPLEKFLYAVGWTRDFLAMATPADIAQDASAATDAYLRRLRKEMQRAIYLTSNYTFADDYVDDLNLPVKRLLNADGAEIPNGPNGEEFNGSTHTHYTANNGWDATALGTAVNNLTEHGHVNNVVIIINKADQSAVEGLTGFKAFPDPRLTIAQDTATPRQTLNLQDIGNRAIGLFKEATVWVKPWAIDDYAFITALGDPRRPLKFRQHPVVSMQGLRTAYQMDQYPLRAEIMEAYLGFGVFWRSNGVVHYAGGASYTAPTIAA